MEKGGVEKRENILCTIKIIYDSTIPSNEGAEREKRNGDGGIKSDF